jgi:predicted ester cyclase
MSTESNKSVIRNMLLIIENGETKNLDKYFAANWVNHDPSLPPMKGLEGAKQLVALWSGFSELKVAIEDAVAEGDRVAMRWTITGKHTGTMMGIAPTGKTIHISGTGIFRIVDGKATDNWVNIDALGLMQQLGVVPMPQM